jgi:hypothetical protein
MMRGVPRGPFAATGFEFLDPLGYLGGAAANGENIELTSELLAGAIKLAHPDLHPPERRDLAHRVTPGQRLRNDLKCSIARQPPNQPRVSSAIGSANQLPRVLRSSSSHISRPSSIGGARYS